MAISDLQQDFTLITEWNNVLTYANQVSTFSTILLSNISALIADSNYAKNASAQESQYINNLQVYMQNFMAQMPANPDQQEIVL